MATRKTVTIDKVKHTLVFAPRFEGIKDYRERVVEMIKDNKNEEYLEERLKDLIYYSLLQIEAGDEIVEAYPDVAGLVTHDATQRFMSNIMQDAPKRIIAFVEEVFADGADIHRSAIGVVGEKVGETDDAPVTLLVADEVKAKDSVTE